MERNERLKLRRERKKMEALGQKFSEVESGSTIEPVYSHEMQKILVNKLTRIEKLLVILVKLEEMQKILVNKLTRIEKLLVILVKLECSKSGIDFEEMKDGNSDSMA